MQFSVQEIINITGGQLVRGHLDQTVGRVSTDSRSLCIGDLFLALLGEHFDGHDFLSQAVINGAMGVVVSRVDVSLKQLNASLVIRVPDTLQAYGDLAKAYREKFDGPVIAVTGSNGKTTTKEMINSVLSVKFSVSSINIMVCIEFKMSSLNFVCFGISDIGTLIVWTIWVSVSWAFLCIKKRAISG